MKMVFYSSVYVPTFMKLIINDCRRWGGGGVVDACAGGGCGGRVVCMFECVSVCVCVLCMLHIFIF